MKSQGQLFIILFFQLMFLHLILTIVFVSAT